MSTGLQSVTLPSGKEIPYSISEKDVKNPRLTLNPDGTLFAVVPPKTPVHTLLSEQLDWIASEYEEQQKERKKITKEYGPLDQGATIWGKSYEFLERTGDYDIELSSAGLTIATPVERSPIKYLRRTLRRALRTAIDTIAQDFCEQLGCHFDTLAIRSQRTKWASCSGGDTLNFNFRCAFLPVSHLRYLVAHEVAHLIEPKHNSQFWHLVESLDTDYEAKKSELQGFWYTLHHNSLWRRLLNEDSG